MSEKLKNNDEILLPKSEVGELRAMELLEELNEAKVDQDGSGQTEKLRQEAYDLAMATAQEVVLEKPVEEMTKEEIGQEYLGILKDLSANFDQSKEGRYGNDIAYIAAHDKSLIKKYDGENAIKNSTSNLLSTADRIIEAENEWREAGDRVKKIEQRLADIEKEKQSMGFFERLLSARARREETGNLHFDLYNGRRSVNEANRRLRDELDAAYSPDNFYQHRPTNKEKDSRSEEFNEKFFSNDRIQKINRAIELRKEFNSKKK